MEFGIGRRQFVSAARRRGGMRRGATQPARPQTPPKPLRIGFVHPVSPKGVPPNYVAFVGRLRELGYVEGDTLAMEYINLEGHLERYDEAMRELVRRRVDLIYALGQEENLRAAMAATSTIPIVMLAISYDPLAKGYVSSLARPTGNVTGISVLGVEAIKNGSSSSRTPSPSSTRRSGSGTRKRPRPGGSRRSSTFARHRARRRRASRPALRLRTRISAGRAGISRRPVHAQFRDFCPRCRTPRRVRRAAPAGLVLRLVADLRGCRRTHVVRRRPRRGGRRAAEFADRIARGAKPATCRSSNRPGSRCGSTSRPPRPSALPSRPPSSRPPTT